MDENRNEPLQKDKTKGLRFAKGKLPLDLITPEMTKAIANVLHSGLQKYEPRNWEKGMPYVSQIMGSLKRHIEEFLSGEDFDHDTKQLLVDHIACNAGMLATMYRRYPEMDDRKTHYAMKRYALDIDGVLADFSGAWIKRLGVDKPRADHWLFSYKIDYEAWMAICEDETFWANLEPLCKPEDILFDPVCYVTARPIPKEWTEQWLEKNGFPCNEVIVIDSDHKGNHGSKVQILKDRNVEIYVDDKIEHFVEISNAGIFCYLFDQPYNRKYDVGRKRIKSLSELKPF